MSLSHFYLQRCLKIFELTEGSTQLPPAQIRVIAPVGKHAGCSARAGYRPSACYVSWGKNGCSRAICSLVSQERLLIMPHPVRSLNQEWNSTRKLINGS